MKESARQYRSFLNRKKNKSDYPFYGNRSACSVSCVLNTHQASFVSSEQQFEFWRLFFLRWGHFTKISDRLFNNDDLPNTIKYFSARPRSHF